MFMLIPSELSSELFEALWCKMVLLFSMLGSLGIRSDSWWSSRQKSPSSRNANSSPGTSCFSQATQRKHSKWKILFLALITKSFLPKDWQHLSHFVPNNLINHESGFKLTFPKLPNENFSLPDIIFFAKGFSVSNKAGTVFVKEHLALAALEAGRVPFEVRGHPQDVLVMYLPSTANTKWVFSAYRKQYVAFLSKSKKEKRFLRCHRGLSNAANTVSTQIVPCSYGNFPPIKVMYIDFKPIFKAIFEHFCQNWESFK